MRRLATVIALFAAGCPADRSEQGMRVDVRLYDLAHSLPIAEQRHVVALRDEVEIDQAVDIEVAGQHVGNDHLRQLLHDRVEHPAAQVDRHPQRAVGAEVEPVEQVVAGQLDEA